jgi:hypothetical protein
LNEAIGQGRLSVVDVRNDGKVANLLHRKGHFGNPRRVESRCPSRHLKPRILTEFQQTRSIHSDLAVKVTQNARALRASLFHHVLCPICESCAQAGGLAPL